MLIAYGLSYAVQGRILKVVLPAESIAITELTATQGTVVVTAPSNAAEVHPSTIAIAATKVNDNVQLVKTNTLSTYQQDFLIIFTALLLIQLFISIRFIQKMLIAPLHESAEAINRLADGQYDLTPAEPSPNELKQLHHQLYKLSEELMRARDYKATSEFQRKSLIAGISHDLKTPLTNIRGYSETLLMDNALTEEQNNFLEVILRNADVANDLITDLSDMNRLDLMQYPLRLEQVNLVPLLKTCIEDASLKLQTLQQQICFKRIEDHLVIRGDTMLLQRLFKNIISNFQQHAGTGTTLSIDWQSNAEGICLRFSDDGIGVAPNTLNHLTDLFYINDKARSKRGNSGLGLYNSQQITTLLGAELTLDSVLGKGFLVMVQFRNL
jgi:signal transduction histidine kinase